MERRGERKRAKQQQETKKKMTRKKGKRNNFEKLYEKIAPARSSHS
jgi:hypothetical protein